MKILCKKRKWKLTEDYNIDKILYLLIDRATDISNFGFIWKKDNNEWHRDYDLPACVSCHDYIYWYKNDTYHRDNNKPARIWIDGKKEYWINGNKQIRKLFVKYQ